MSTKTTTPKQATVVREAIRRAIRGARVAIPARVEVYSAGTATQRPTVDVLPLLQDALPGDPLASNLPVIRMVPIVYPSTATTCLAFPLAVGDCVLLVFADRSLDAWLSGTKTDPQDPQDTRHHALTDAIAIPGLFQDAVPLADAINDGDVRLSYADGAIRAGVRIVTATGDVVLETATGVVRLGSATASTPSVPQPALSNVITAFAISYVSALMSQLITLAGALVVPTGIDAGAKSAFTAAVTTLQANLASELIAKMNLPAPGGFGMISNKVLIE